VIRREPLPAIARRLAAYELPLVLIGLPLFLLWPAWSGGALVVVGMLWLSRWLAYGRFSRPAPPNLLVFLLLALVPLSLVVTPTPAVTRVQAGYLLAGVALYFAVLHWTLDARRLQALLGALLVVLLALTVFSPLLIEGHEGIRWLPAGMAALARRLPERINPNVLAGNLAPWWPLTLALAWRPPIGHPRRWRGLAGVTGTALGLVLVGLASRGVWLALGMAGLFLLPLVWPRLRRGWPLLPALLWLAVAQRLPERLAAVTLDTGALGGMGVRAEIWRRAVFALGDFALTGMGMGAWEQVAPLLYPYRQIGLNTPVPHAHQLFLQIGLDLGVPGLVLLMAMMGLSVGMAWQSFAHYRQRTDPEGRFRAALALALVAGLLILLGHGLVDAVTWGTKPAVLTWLLLALTTVLYLSTETPAPSSEVAADESAL
jgi:putative inorganic carbon (HCO3(-)) transporter